MPGSPVTKHTRLGPIFGQPLFNLDSDHLPKKSEIVRFWMYFFELERGDSFIMKDDQQKAVKNEVSLFHNVFKYFLRQYSYFYIYAVFSRHLKMLRE